MTVDRSAGGTPLLGRSYDKPLVKTLSYGSVDFGAGGDATAIRVPAGMRFASILDIEVAATETFNAVTTQAFVRIGTASDADKFAELALGTLADTDSFSLRDDTDAVKDADNLIDLDNDGDAGAALSQLELVFVAPTGGTPAGIGYVNITIAFWGEP